MSLFQVPRLRRAPRHRSARSMDPLTKMRAHGHADGTFDLLHVAVSIVAMYVVFHVLRIFLCIFDVEIILPLYSRDRGVLGISFIQWTVIISVLLIVWTGVAALATGPGDAPQRAISAVMTCAAILILVYCIDWMTLDMSGIQPGVPANPRQSSGR